MFEISRGRRRGSIYFHKEGKYFVYKPINLLGGRMFRSVAESSVRNFFLGLSERSDPVKQCFLK